MHKEKINTRDEMLARIMDNAAFIKVPQNEPQKNNA